MLRLNWLYSRLDLRLMSFSPNSSFCLLMSLSQFFLQGLSRCLISSLFLSAFLVDILTSLDNNFQFSSSITLFCFSACLFKLNCSSSLASTDLGFASGDLLLMFLSFSRCLRQSSFLSNSQSGLLDMYLTSILINILAAPMNYATAYIKCNVIIMDSESEDKNHRIVIKLSIAQKQYKKTIELADNYLAKFGPAKEVHMFRATACSQLGRAKECLQDLQHAAKLGSTFRQVAPLKIRSLIQLSLPYEAQKQLSKLLKENSQLDQIMKLSKAIEYAKDPFQVYKLIPKQQQIMNSMDNWLLRAGASYPKLKTINLSAGYRGVIAVKHISKGESIIYIPKSELITLEMARSTKICQALISKQCKLQSPKHTYLSLLLLQLKSTSAPSLIKFKPYLDILPTDHTPFPINYSKQQLSMLEGSPFLNMIYEKVIDLKKDYDTVIKCMDSAGVTVSCGKFGFGDFCWARTIVGSRIFGILVSGIKTQILVPFADMLNHRHPKQTAWNYEQGRNGFVIQSLEDIEVGQQVFDSYGRKCNSRFLLNYGFVLDDNPDNQISLRLAIQNEHPLASTKKAMMRENANEIFAIVKKVSMNLNTNKFYELMGCLRFICIEDNETLTMLKKISNIEVTGEPYSIIRTPPISIKNQIQIWEKLGAICQEQISKYSSTLEHDLELLQKRQLNENEKNIITLRAGEKKLLTQFISMAKEVAKLLRDENMIQALQSKVTTKYARYLYKILMLIPSMNKKKLEKKLANYFTAVSEENVEETEQVPQS